MTHSATRWLVLLSCGALSAATATATAQATAQMVVQEPERSGLFGSLFRQDRPVRGASAFRSRNAPSRGRSQGRTASGTIAHPTPLNLGAMPELTPERAAGTHIELGRVLELKGHHEAAEIEYRRALRMNDGKLPAEIRAEAHRRLATLLDRQGKFADSARHHETALELVPKNGRVWNDAGYSAYLQGRWDLAVERLRKARRFSPGDKRVLTNLGLALAAQGEREEAFSVLAEASGPAAAHANIAYVLAGQGKPEAAREHYRRSLSTNPDLTLARRGLARLDDAQADAALVQPPIDREIRPSSATNKEPAEAASASEPAETQRRSRFGRLNLFKLPFSKRDGS